MKLPYITPNGKRAVEKAAEMLGNKSALAQIIGFDKARLSRVMNGQCKMPPKFPALIEKATNGLVTVDDVNGVLFENPTLEKILETQLNYAVREMSLDSYLSFLGKVRETIDVYLSTGTIFSDDDAVVLAYLCDCSPHTILSAAEQCVL